MIDGAVKILEKVIQLLERREKAKRNLFLDYIEPIYIDMEKIHSHYLTEFTSLLTEYLETTRSSAYFVEKLKNKKTEMEALRVKVYSIAKHQAYDNRDKLPEDVAYFMNSCLNYFRISSGELRNYSGHYTDLINLLSNPDLTDIGEPLDEQYLDFIRSHYGRGYEMHLFGLEHFTYVTESWTGNQLVERTERKVPALINSRTLRQNLEIILAYIRISWDEISIAYSNCRTNLLKNNRF